MIFQIHIFNHSEKKDLKRQDQQAIEFCNLLVNVIESVHT